MLQFVFHVALTQDTLLKNVRRNQMNQNDLSWLRFAASIVDKTPEEVAEKINNA
jgi:hypothetical protein